MQQQTFSRRSFLKYALLGGGSLLAVGALVRFWPRKSFGKLVTLNDYLGDALEAFAEVTLPREPGMPDATTAQVIRRLDEELTFVAPQISSDFIAAIYLIEFSPAAYGFFGRMSRLEPAKRIAYLKRAGGEGSDLVRAAVSNIRMLILLSYYGHASAWPKIGYDGPYGALPEKLSEQRLHYRKLTGENT